MRVLLTVGVGVLTLLAATPSLPAVEVLVTAIGSVEFNQINDPPLGNAVPGDVATLTFTVDSDDFVDSTMFSTRGYPIDQASFSLQIGADLIGLQNPFPAGQTPYLSIRNDDPGVDGFMVTNDFDSPIGVPLDQEGAFEHFRNNFYVTYVGSTLPSLDILDALGTYDFTGLTVFNWTIDDGPFNAMGLIFEQMTLELAGTGPVFSRGDANDDGEFDISDVVFVLNFLFVPGSEVPPCEKAADFNDDGAVDISDPIYLLDHLFVQGPPLPPPHPDCGTDPTDDALTCGQATACP